MYKYRFGFTLAETMIAVAIIGIIAALTIPAFVKSYNERANFTKLLKMHHDLEQNLEFLRTENIYGGYLQSYLYTGTEDNIKNFFNKYYSVKKQISSIEGNPFTFTYAARLKDGSIMAMIKVGSGERENSYTRVFVDVNGSEPPNENCEDRYEFNIYDNYKIDVINPYSTSGTPNLRDSSSLGERLRCVGKYINNDWKRE